MRHNTVRVKALVVMAMALLGWFSPTRAEPLGVGCNQWTCLEVIEGCNDQIELTTFCQRECPTFNSIPCFDQDIECELGEVWMMCHHPS